MAEKLVRFDDSLGVMDEIGNMNLRPKVALATYLNYAFGEYLPAMTDEDWLQEAGDLLEMVGVEK